MELTNNALAQCLNIHDLFRNLKKKEGGGVNQLVIFKKRNINFLFGLTM